METKEQSYVKQITCRVDKGTLESDSVWVRDSTPSFRLTVQHEEPNKTNENNSVLDLCCPACEFYFEYFNKVENHTHKGSESKQESSNSVSQGRSRKKRDKVKFFPLALLTLPFLYEPTSDNAEEVVFSDPEKLEVVESEVAVNFEKSRIANLRKLNSKRSHVLEYLVQTHETSVTYPRNILNTVNVFPKTEADVLSRKRFSSKRAKAKLDELFSRSIAYMPLTHQARLYRKFETSTPDVFLLMWSMGSGKTKFSLSLLNLPAFNTPVSKKASVFQIFAPNSVLGYWASTFEQMPQTSGERTYCVLSGFSQTAMGTQPIPGAFLIVDEAHSFRNMTDCRAWFRQEMAKCSPILALSGSMVYRGLLDMLPWIQIIEAKTKFLPRGGRDVDCDTIPDDTDAKYRQELITRARTYLYGKIDMFNPFDNSNTRENYPTVLVEPLTVSYLTLAEGMRYLTHAQRNIGNVKITSYNSRRAHRDICNSPLKIEALLSNIMQAKFELRRYPQIVYTSRVQTSLTELENLLKKLPNRLKVEKIIGTVGTFERNEIINRYNSGKVDILLIGPAGREGINCLGTVALHMLDMPSIPSEIDQITGRAIREGSHSHLDPVYRTVSIFKYVSVLPSTGSYLACATTQDEYNLNLEFYGTILSRHNNLHECNHVEYVTKFIGIPLINYLESRLSTTKTSDQETIERHGSNAVERATDIEIIRDIASKS